MSQTQTAVAESSDTFDFYKCQKCGRIVTGLEMAAALGFGSGQPCPCGAVRFAPMNITWREYRQPQVIRYARHRFAPAGLNVSDRAHAHAVADDLLCEDVALEAAQEGLTPEAIADHVAALRRAQAELL